MSLRGYKKKTKPALWKSLPGYAAGSLVDQVKKFQPRIRPVSKRRQAATAEYRAAAKKFVKDAIKAGKTCPVFDAYASLPPQAQAFLRQPWDGRLRCVKVNEVHHTRGRAGALLNDQRFWLAVSKWGHRLIHTMPELARQRGWMCHPGQWNTPLKENS